jgi:glutamate--cysteine ligase catalytic subunit
MYQFIDSYLGKNQVLSCASFPKLGDKSEALFYNAQYLESDYIHPHKETLEKETHKENEDLHELYSSHEDLKTNPFSKSKYIDDSIINTHPRFGTLTRNIRTRRGSKVDIQVPIYKDINTITDKDESNPGFIHLDAMAFGMGCCALQITLGTCTLNSTCYLYDQFIPIMPLLLALSSSGPIYRGKLSGFDNRFSVICQAVDDRTEEERNPMSNKYIYKSRYSPAYSYISQHEYVQDYHNDYHKFPINQEYLKTMVEGGIPERLSRHFCNLLVRDPLVIFEDKIDIADKSDRSHFENFNSTNWNSLRFKPPRPEDNDTCFKIEVRPCDLQLTPFENSSFLGLLLALYASVFNFDVNFIMPITKVDENFERAYLQDSVTEKKFWWRINSIDNEFKNINHSLIQRKFLSNKDREVPSKEMDDENIKELTMKEIFFGTEEYNYPGLIKLCYKAIEMRFADDETRNYLGRFIEFIGLRATGKDIF